MPIVVLRPAVGVVLGQALGVVLRAREREGLEVDEAYAEQARSVLLKGGEMFLPDASVAEMERLGLVASAGGNAPLVPMPIQIDGGDGSMSEWDNFYGDPGMGGGATPAVGALITIPLSIIARGAPWILHAVRPLVGKRILWVALNGAIRQVLIWLGVKEAYEVIFEDDTGGSGGGGGGALVPIGPGSGSGPGDIMVPGNGLPAGAIGSWVANGITFYRLADGRFAVQNSKGRWKVWRAKKPIVIMPGGAGSLATLLRADRVLNAQAKRLRKMLDRRAPRASRKAAKTVIVESGSGHVIT